MGSWTTWIIFIWCVGCYTVLGRKALDDVCARGAFSFCQSINAQRDLPQPTQQQAQPIPPSNGAPPHTPFSVTPPPLPTVGEYCAKYLEHYNYFCAGKGAKDGRANDFCPTYTSNCDVSAISPPATTPLPELPPTKIQQVCSDYQGLANQYCFRPVIPKGWGVRKNCDLYLKYCVPTATDQLKNKTLQQAIRDNLRPCDKYMNDYTGFCVQNPTPYNAHIAEFCKNYKATCVPVQMASPESLAVVQSPVAQQSLPVMLQPQVQQQFQPGQIQQLQPSQVDAAQLQAAQLQAAQQSQAVVQPQPQTQPMGNPNVVNPMATLGNPTSVSNPLGALSAPPVMPNPASTLISSMQGTAPNGVPVDAAGNPLQGMAAHPLAFGQQTAVGQMAGYSSGAAINPFGQVATGKAVNAGPVGVMTGNSVDFSGIPGLGQLGSLPLLGKRRRRRNASLLVALIAGQNR